jgi:lycopene beta-cyclase
MIKQHFDTIILGGGCSGLSLGLTLAKKEPYQSILIIESRSQYIPDRTWCFWNVKNHPFERLVRYNWKRWQVRYKGQKISLGSSQYEYQCIPSEAFYQEAILQISNRANVTLLMGVHVCHIREETLKIFLETTHGVYTCRRAYDSRPEDRPAGLYQHFHGWHIVCESPIFDPAEVILMDFDLPQTSGLNFMYLLPFSPCSALVEATYVTPKVLEQKMYERNIQEYLDLRYGLRSYDIVYQETGVLPLQAKSLNPNTSPLIPIGTRAGWMRASTGYAFIAIQEGIQELLNRSEIRKTRKIENYLDSLFLSYIQEHPELAPELFFTLFKNNKADVLVRFLSGNWSYRDLLKIILSMPKLAMIKKVFR